MSQLKETREPEPKWRQNEEENEKEERRCRTQNESKARVCGGRTYWNWQGMQRTSSVWYCAWKNWKEKQKTDNMPTVNKEMRQSEGIHSLTSWGWGVGWCCGEGGAGDGPETGVRSWLEGMQIDHSKRCNHFHDTYRKKVMTVVGQCLEYCLYQLYNNPVFTNNDQGPLIYKDYKLILWYILMTPAPACWNIHLYILHEYEWISRPFRPGEVFGWWVNINTRLNHYIVVCGKIFSADLLFKSLYNVSPFYYRETRSFWGKAKNCQQLGKAWVHVSETMC